ncbi:histidine kinase [Litoribacter ruber]|uniref:Histidine kinase n=1 Tax=Litoribacter ruber TaxID=702568 RepID=A0AAP2CP76_9BACT|nr:MULTISPECIES: histidine kinase [Litoribacter]MBS9525357.1 histidine kinase [Litoribacter alkaliphilus]MBT0809743.1 histidine kinase [Litoribacter ruber]
MNKTRLYWILQIVGWSGFALINLMFLSLARGITGIQIGAYFSLAAFYFLSTHAFRYVIKTYGWFNLQIPKLIVHALLGLVVLSFLNTGAQVIINLAFDTLDVNEDLRPVVILVNLFISFLYYSLWSMMYFLFHFLDNYNTTLKYQAKINEIKLNHLRSQLNPHFIFNALNSVRALVDEDPVKAKSAITQLSNILRFSLIMDNKKVISFGDEFNTVKDYLNLEKIRFEERLSVSYEVEQEAYRFKIPPMMLQTIVENAIKHGISNLVKGGIVQLKCSVGLSGDLYIQVKNSGQLRNPQSRRKEGGHGINNTVQRLKMIYGSKASFKIYNSGSDFVITEIKIPKQSLTLE